jgi:serine/threonine protein kinase/uncharacterized RDD family membrane protein YckC
MEGSSACNSCGWQPGSEPDNTLYLPQGYILNNRYLIGKVIGVGGFGIVYVAWDTNLDIRVAIKEFLAKDYAARSADHVSLTPYAGNAREEHALGIEKFVEEAKALAKFQDHPGIVKVNESFLANNTAYMVMQYLDGMTLKEYLKRQPGEKMAYNMAVKAMIPIMDALREVHKAGFVHRDISPDNIFITRQKQIKLLDFGAARYAIGEHSKSLTSVLKHGYAPVEQYSSKGDQGPWSDVYAVAATIYRCVTGQIPPDAMERIQEDTIKSLKQLGIDIPLNGELALMRGLAVKASARFENIQQFQQALTSGQMPAKASTAPDEVIQPSRPQQRNFVECPECGAKNQLNPGDDPRALRCGKCKRELGVSSVTSNNSVITPVDKMVNVQVCIECGAKGNIYTKLGNGLNKCNECGAEVADIKLENVNIGKSIADQHPWRRYFAKTVDCCLLGLSLIFLLSIFVGIFMPSIAQEYVSALNNQISAGIILMLLFIPAEAILLSTVGNTPAKWLFGISIRSSNGSKLTFGQAIERSFRAGMQGMGLGIPLIAFFTQWFAYRRLSSTGSTLWDTSVGAKVYHKDWGAGRTIICVISVILTFAVVGALKSGN